MRCMIISVLVLSAMFSAMFSGMLSGAAFATERCMVSVLVEHIGKDHWRAMARNENGELCGVAHASHRIEAARLARKDCGC